MLYLFNSASRANYLENISNTLFYSNGWINDYRYRFSGNTIHVDVSKIPELEEQVGKDVLIIFVDRFSTGEYCYLPIRKGKLRACYKDGDRIFFNVEVCDFIWPKDLKVFNGALAKAVPTLPKLTDNNPEATNDGQYAVIGDDIIPRRGDYVHGQEAWQAITTALEETRAFSRKADSEAIFARINAPIKPRSHKKSNNAYSSFYKVVKGRSYQFTIFYRYPGQHGNEAVTMKIIKQDALKFITAESFSLNNNSNKHDIEFNVKRSTEELSDKFELEFTKSNTGITLITPHPSLALRISTGSRFWLQTCFAGILFILSNIIATFDFSKLTQPSIGEALALLNYWKVGAAILNAIALLWIFRLWGGKKPL